MVGSAKMANLQANMVLKYLRWRNTDSEGISPPGYRGEVFDLVAGAVLHGVRVWQPDARGQGGRFGEDVFDWSWRHWLANVHHADLNWILGGGHVVGAGCGPLQGSRDPRPGLPGPIWDFYVVLE